MYKYSHVSVHILNIWPKTKMVVLRKGYYRKYWKMKWYVLGMYINIKTSTQPASSPHQNKLSDFKCSITEFQSVLSYVL